MEASRVIVEIIKFLFGYWDEDKACPFTTPKGFMHLSFLFNIAHRDPIAFNHPTAAQ
jgi:hypothetical protein